jgi:uncharacterized protein (TIGR00369 family)
MSDKARSFDERFNARIAEVLAAQSKTAPYTSLLGIEISEQSPGRLVCRLPVRDALKNGIGIVHGGAIVSLADHALSVVVYPLVEPGRWVATLELKTSYLKAVKAGELVAEATVLSLGQRIGTVRIDVRNVVGDETVLAAAAMGTVYIRDPPSGHSHTPA